MVEASELGEADAALDRFWRGPRLVENRVHPPYDGALGKDAGQAWAGRTPHVLAAQPNAVLLPFQTNGWTSNADAVRDDGTSVDGALPVPTVT